MPRDGQGHQRPFGLVAVKGDFGELFGPAKARPFGQHPVRNPDLRFQMRAQCRIASRAPASDV